MDLVLNWEALFMLKWDVLRSGDWFRATLMTVIGYNRFPGRGKVFVRQRQFLNMMRWFYNSHFTGEEAKLGRHDVCLKTSCHLLSTYSGSSVFIVVFLIIDLKERKSEKYRCVVPLLYALIG